MKGLIANMPRLAKASVILLVACAVATLAWAAEETKGEEQEVKVTLEQVPAPVKAVFEKEAQGGKINEIVKEVEDGKTTFEAEVVKDGKEFDVKVAEDGKVLEKESGDEEKGEKEGGKDEDEDEKAEKDVKMTLAQVPAPVKTALETESKGGTIKEIEKEVEDGKTIYSAEIIVDGKKTDLELAEDGKVLKRESGDEDKDKDADDEKDEAKADGAFLKAFGEDKADLGPTGKNDYFILEPGYVMTLEGKEDGKDAVLVVTVLDETKDVDGVKTRIIEERESQGGKVVEISRNYYAISKKTNNVYYFGEESKEFEDGKMTSTEGSWESGKNGAQYGLFMPAKPKVGEKYYQEIAPQDKAMDRAETVSLTEKVTVPAGTFENGVKTKETSAVESGTEYKTYAPGVGLLEDGGLKLTKYSAQKK